ncbi:DUF6477 family protein [Pelagimonas sp. KU-00592-HH]|uniref:DUF6477 family protein n=1 Tax=Roseobacteraceae TaxID=2854170 RepID=UPI0020CE303F|nr:DUF6477 family protein [Shimia sp. CNT1-13L.2]MCP9482070.1 DUF6477 family protein [Shimia sp. CNT1-13L.2]
MKDILGHLNTLKRPRLLIRAARAGVDGYSRTEHLQRHFGYGKLPRNAVALMSLMEKEAQLNDQRRKGDAGYSLVSHVDTLIAMMGEAQLMRASRQRV